MKRHAAFALLFGVAGCAAPPEIGDAEDVAEVEQAESLTEPSEANAIRFLEQATFGPRLANGAATLPIDSVEKVVAVGITQSITNQFNATGAAFDGNPSPVPSLESQFFTQAIDGQDQLRQRVAFALAQIVVIGSGGIPQANAQKITGSTLYKVTTCNDENGVIFEHCKTKQAMAVYLNILRNNALGNYKTLLTQITKSAVMGQYLDMVNNRAFNTAGAAIEPNENYARELLQLFTVGLYQMDEFGEQILDGNNMPVPVYTENHVKAFARALSGWAYAKNGGTGDPLQDCPGLGKAAPLNYLQDMIPCEENHDSSSQTLLRGVNTVAGQTATQHLNAAITNLFDDPNLPPYICKQLIQHLVTANPSPQYVFDVVQVFKNDGATPPKRGNLRAVVRKILEHNEARGPQPPLGQFATYGHLRNPALQLTNMVRWLDGHMDPAKDGGAKLAAASAAMGQSITKSPSVFSFYAPTVALPGQPTLFGPEFGIFNASTSTTRANIVYDLLFTAAYTNNGVVLNLNMLPADPNDLVVWLAQYPLHSAASADVQLAIYDAITKTGTWASTTDRKKKSAAMFAFVSPEFAVQR